MSFELFLLQLSSYLIFEALYSSNQTSLLSNQSIPKSLLEILQTVFIMAAIDNQIPIIKVLIVLYPGVDAMDVLGPMEVLNQALHNTSDPCKSISDSNASLALCLSSPLSSHMRS